MSEEMKEQEQEQCTHDCSSCSANCGSKKPDKSQFAEPMNSYSNVKKVIGVVSGKGGVGKSFVTSYLAVLMNRMGYKTAILDADMTGPSIPMGFGIHKKAQGNELGIIPEYSEKGIGVMSVNLLLDSEESPVVWRGPVIAGTVKQFWSQVVWGDVDFMFVDMPPGTGDVPLTVFQSLPVDQIVIVTSPQDLVSMVVAKAVNMAKAMDVPVLGLVENYSYLECEKCGERTYVFGESHLEEIAKKQKLPILGRLPIKREIAESVDAGKIESLEGDWLNNVSYVLAELLPKEIAEEGKGRITIAVTADEDGNVFQHFGHCERFSLFQMDDGILMGRSEILTDGNGHEAMISVLKEKEVNVLICGGIGTGAMTALMEEGILVVPGIFGDINVAVESYLDGSLQVSSSANCSVHEEGKDCGSNCSGSCQK